MFNIPINPDIVFWGMVADHKHGKLLQFGASKIQSGKAFQGNWYSNPGRSISQNVIKLIGSASLGLVNTAPSNKIVLGKIYRFINESFFVNLGDFAYKFLSSLFEKELWKRPKVTFLVIHDEWNQ